MKRFKKVPNFKTEDEEREFWNKNSSTEYVDWKRGEVGNFPNLKPTYKSISLRLPESLLNDLKIVAHKKDIPYQSLMKIILSEKIKKEFAHH